MMPLPVNSVGWERVMSWGVIPGPPPRNVRFPGSYETFTPVNNSSPQQEQHDCGREGQKDTVVFLLIVCESNIRNIKVKRISLYR